jgi:hypothetical protein
MNSNQNHSNLKTQKQNAIRRQMKVLHISFTECNTEIFDRIDR